MTSKELSQLYHLNREIEMLQDQLDKLNRASKNERVFDTVKGSQSCFPYVEHPIAIYGIPIQAFTCGKYALEIAEITALLELRAKTSIIEKVRLERYIESIDDPDIRQIFALRHVNGLRWAQIAVDLGYANEDSVRKKHDRYLQKK